MLSVICFSKDRPLQLEAYLQSLLWYSGMPSSVISVLYVDSPEISYEMLRKRYPDIHWRRQSSFYFDLLDLVRLSENFVLLGCDDVFFTDYFDVNVAMERLVAEPALFGFSLRLGLNLHSLPDISRQSDILEWNWQKAVGHWGYPWDVSASIYRRDDVETYLVSTPEAINPNYLEAIRAKDLAGLSAEPLSLLTSFVRSKCLTLTINRVQEEFPNEFDDSRKTDIDTLYHAHIEGQYLDWPSFAGVSNSVIHVDASYFKLCKTIVFPNIELKESSKNPRKIIIDSDIITCKIIYWRCVIALKETLRPYIPRKVMQILRRIITRN